MDQHGITTVLPDQGGAESGLDEIRRATNGNFALGNERFAVQVSLALDRRVVPGKSGRPRKASEQEQ